MTETTVFLIRHAEAGERAAWTRPDLERPLTRVGRRQSAALVARFARIPLTQLVSSPYVRCIQTLEPLAEVLGIRVQARDELREGEPIGYVEKTVLDAATEGPAAICVHGDGLSGLLGSLAERDVPLEGSVDDHAKGSVWILRIADGVIVSGRYEPPLV